MAAQRIASDRAPDRDEIRSCGKVEKVKLGAGMRTIKTSVLLALIVGALLPAPASADSARTDDPNDTKGKLDVRSVRQSHDGERIVHTVRTFERWGSPRLSGDETYIGFYLDDSTDDTDADRFVWVRYKAKRGLYAQIFRPGTHANGERLGSVRVTRPNQRSARISLRPGQLTKGLADGYRWRVTTSFEKSTKKGPCGDDGEASSFPTGECVDNVPRRSPAGMRHEP